VTPTRWALPLLLGLATGGGSLVAQSDLPDSASRRLVPSFATGLLWVTPLPVTPRELAARLTGSSPREIHDSVVDLMAQRYLEAVAAEQARAPRLPSWTTAIGGQPVGVDSRWIYLGPIKVPTFLLALLPINLDGNPIARDQWRKRSAMLEDIDVAGRRAANLDDLELSIRRVRERIEDEELLRRNQRIPPPREVDPP
jgi:hypothetical protein